MLTLLHLYPFNPRSARDWCSFTLLGEKLYKPISWAGKGVRDQVPLLSRISILTRIVEAHFLLSGLPEPFLIPVPHLFPLKETPEILESVGLGVPQEVSPEPQNDPS